MTPPSPPTLSTSRSSASLVSAGPIMLDVDAWLDEESRGLLDLVASSVVELAGFSVAVINIVRQGMMTTVSAAGGDAALQALVGTSKSVDSVMRLLALGEDWGRFRYVPESAQPNDLLAGWTWTPSEDTPSAPTSSGPEAWDPEDMCVAPLRSHTGELIGMLSIDLPLDGVRPGPAHRALLDRYAAQAERTVDLTLQRLDMTERARLAETTREVVRLITAQNDLSEIFAQCHAALLDGYRCDSVAMRTFPFDGLPAQIAGPIDVAIAHHRVAGAVARDLWQEQRTLMVNEMGADGTVSEANLELIRDGMRRAGIRSGFMAPIGAGESCLGVVVIGSADALRVWTDQERSSAMEVGRDLGQAVRNAGVRLRELRLRTELEELSTYRRELLSTVSHELKNPLTVVDGHLELLDAAPELSSESQFSVNAMLRAVRRGRRLVDDLLLLSQVDEAASSQTVPVAIGPVLAEAIEQVRFAGDQRGIRIDVEQPAEPLRALATVEELDRVLTNLLTNAIKYGSRGTAVHVVVERRDDTVAVQVRDEGIGISTEDVGRLFTEFFRSGDPRAREQAGTGLGLAICQRIAHRYGGRIDVDSTLGEGSTFTLVLPAA